MSRVYAVQHDQEIHLVRATTKSQAVRHIADKLIVANVATQQQLIVGLEAGQKIEVAGNEVTE